MDGMKIYPGWIKCPLLDINLEEEVETIENALVDEYKATGELRLGWVFSRKRSTSGDQRTYCA